MKKITSPALAALFASALAIVPTAKAASFSFNVLEDNSPIDLSGQLRVVVSDVGGTQVAFTFFNDIGFQSSITDVYFQATFTPPPSITQSSGVSFSSPATPPTLPGDGGFVTTLGLTADSNPPNITANGINVLNESLTLTFDYLGSSYPNFAGVLAAIDANSLRIGLHIQGLSDGESETYVNNGEIPGEGSGVAASFHTRRNTSRLYVR